MESTASEPEAMALAQSTPVQSTSRMALDQDREALEAASKRWVGHLKETEKLQAYIRNGHMGEAKILEKYRLLSQENDQLSRLVEQGILSNYLY